MPLFVNAIARNPIVKGEDRNQYPVRMEVLKPPFPWQPKRPFVRHPLTAVEYPIDWFVYKRT